VREGEKLRSQAAQGLPSNCRRFVKLKTAKLIYWNYIQYSIFNGAIVAWQKVEVCMRSMRICSAVIYFMARGERLTKEQVFGQQGNPVYAIWPVGKLWGVAYHNGKRWASLSYVPQRTERGAYDYAIGHYYSNF